MKHKVIFSLFLLILLFKLSTISSQNLTLGVNPNVKNYYIFNGNQTFTGNVTIKKRAIVIFRCGIFKFNPGKGIIVMEGAKLYLQNATLTQTADINGNSTTLNTSNNWLGIQVWGNPNADQQNSTCVNAASCSNYDFTRDSSYGDHGTDPQGELQMHLSKIRYSNFGVTLCGLQNDPGYAPYYMYPFFAGGLLIARESFFENNYHRDVIFGWYYKFMNKSIISKNTFKYDHLTNSWPTFQHNHRCIINNYTSFKYNIEFNNFSVYTLFNNFWGIENWGYMKICNNTFKYHMAGVITFKETTPFKFPNYNVIKENIFDECQVGIDIKAALKVRVELNNIKTCSFKREINGGPTFMTYFSNSLPGYSANQNGTVGIYNNNSFNSKISYNAYTRWNAILSNEDANFATYYSGTFPTTYFKNTSTSAANGFRSISDNRGVKIECNKFKGARINDILNDNGALLGNQGTLGKSRGNEFTRSSIRLDINNKNTVYSTNRLKYYYYNSGAQEPLYITTSTVEKQSAGANDCTSGEELPGVNYESGCSTNIIKYPTGAIMTLYTETKDDIDDIVIGGINEEEQEEYDELMHRYDIMMTDIIDNFAANSIINEYDVNDSIRDFLLAHNTLTSKLYLLDWYIAQEEYTNAEELIDSLNVNHPGDFTDDLTEYNEFIIDMMQNNDSTNAWLFNHFNDIKTIADAEGYMSVAARNIAQLIANLDSNNAYFDTQIYHTYLPGISDTLTSNTETDSFTIFPVPFSSNLTVTINNFTGYSRTFVIKLKDLAGDLVYTNSFVVLSNDINSDTINTLDVDPGLYIIEVYEDGILLRFELVNKT